MHITHALCSDGEQGTLSFLQSLDAKEKGRCTPSPPPTPPPRSPSPYLPPPPAGRISPTSPPSGRICSYQPPQGRTRLSVSSVSSKHFDGRVGGGANGACISQENLDSLTHSGIFSDQWKIVHQNPLVSS